MSRVIVIGDIHGCLEELKELHQAVGVGPGDRVICVGDFMDKGPRPVECVQFARKHGYEAVLGNHEEKHLRWRKHTDRKRQDPSYDNPMRPLPAAYQAQNARLSAEDVAWLQACPPFIRALPNWVVVHGGVFPGAPVEQQAKDKEMKSQILRLRWLDKNTNDYLATIYDDAGNPVLVPDNAVHWSTKYDGHANVVYGHEAHDLKLVRRDRRPQGVSCYGIDTGCVHGGHLTALIVDEAKSLDEPEFVQVKAKREYAIRPKLVLPRKA